MKSNKEQVRELAAPVAERHGAFLIDVQIRGERGESVAQVLVDTDEGISLATCAAISRELGPLLESADVFGGRYRIEVSSPGLDKPLRLARQYRKNVGRSFRVRYGTPDGERTASMTLTAIDGEKTEWTTEEGRTVVVEFGDIRECLVELPW